MRLFAGLVLSCLVALPVMAEEDGNLRTLDTGIVAGRWAAVGRIDLGGRGFCTGTLIEPDIVLTAAHCLYDKATGAAMPAAELTFLAGWRNGRAEAYRGVTAAVPHPDYIFDRDDRDEQVAQVPLDVGLLKLDQPILLPSIPPAVTGDDPSAGDRVQIVSYAKDRSEAPSIQDVCEVIAVQADMSVLDCPVDFGASGAPVFRETAHGMVVVSVISAKAEAMGKDVALAAPLEVPLATVRARLATTGRAAAPGVRVLSGGSAASGGGAKFVKVGETP